LVEASVSEKDAFPTFKVEVTLLEFRGFVQSGRRGSLKERNFSSREYLSLKGGNNRRNEKSYITGSSIIYTLRRIL
jgi:hypothetical protein